MPLTEGPATPSTDEEARWAFSAAQSTPPPRISYEPDLRCAQIDLPGSRTYAGAPGQTISIYKSKTGAYSLEELEGGETVASLTIPDIQPPPEEAAPAPERAPASTSPSPRRPSSAPSSSGATS